MDDFIFFALHWLFIISIILFNSFITTYLFYILAKYGKIFRNLEIVTYKDKYYSGGFMFYSENFSIEIIDIQNNKTLIKTDDKDVILVIYTNITQKLITFIHEIYHYIEGKLNLPNNEAISSIVEQLTFVLGPFSIVIGIILNYILVVLGINNITALEYENLWYNRYIIESKLLERFNNRFVIFVIDIIFPWIFYCYTIWYLIKRKVYMWLGKPLKIEIEKKIIEGIKNTIKNKIVYKLLDTDNDKELLKIKLKLKENIEINKSMIEFINEI